MEKKEVTLQYRGFNPSDDTREYLESHMEELQTEAPANSVVHAIFTRQNRSFSGRVRIDSGGGHFFAIANGTKMTEVTHRLVTQVRRQLGKWKDNRLHQHQKIQDVPFKTSEYGEVSATA